MILTLTDSRMRAPAGPTATTIGGSTTTKRDYDLPRAGYTSRKCGICEGYSREKQSFPRISLTYPATAISGECEGYVGYPSVTPARITGLMCSARFDSRWRRENRRSLSSSANERLRRREEVDCDFKKKKDPKRREHDEENREMMGERREGGKYSSEPHSRIIRSQRA